MKFDGIRFRSLPSAFQNIVLFLYCYLFYPPNTKELLKYLGIKQGKKQEPIPVPVNGILVYID